MRPERETTPQTDRQTDGHRETERIVRSITGHVWKGFSVLSLLTCLGCCCCSRCCCCCVLHSRIIPCLGPHTVQIRQDQDKMQFARLKDASGTRQALG